jgi:hypothetical protein
MNINDRSKGFTPITITIETREEAAVLAAIIGPSTGVGRCDAACIKYGGAVESYKEASNAMHQLFIELNKQAR